MSSEAGTSSEAATIRERAISVERVDRLIGNTPMVRLRRLGDPDGAPIYIKMENVNPSGSMRDRYIVEILQRSVEAGVTMAGDKVALAGLDDSAISASLLAGMLGLSVHLFVPESSSHRLLKLAQRLGGQIHWTSAEGALDGAIKQAAAWAREAPDRLYVDGFRRQAVQDAYRGIANEILLTLRDRHLGAFVTSVSTGGTFRRVPLHLRESHPELYVGGAVLIDADLESLRHHERDVLEHISLERAWQMRDEVAQAEGLLLGPKGAACVALALELQGRLSPDEVIVTLNPDAGQRYLGWEDTPLFNPNCLTPAASS